MNPELDSMYKQGKAQFRKGNFAEAEDLLTRVLAKKPRFADLHGLLGIIKHDRGEFAKAIGHFKKALEINPDYAEVRLNLMITYNDLGKYEEAKKLLDHSQEYTTEDGLQIDPISLSKIANSHAYTAELYIAIDDHKNAARELEQALALRPQYADLRVRLGIAYRMQGRLTDSVIQLVEALKINPNYVYARVQLGLSYFEMKKEPEALRQWELVLTIDPKNELAQTYKELLESGELSVVATKKTAE